MAIKFSRRKDSHYMISVDGRWVGKWVPIGIGKQRAFGVKPFDTKKAAVRSAAHRKFEKTVTVYRSWGSGPKQRELVWKKRKGRKPWKKKTKKKRRKKRK